MKRFSYLTLAVGLAALLFGGSLHAASPTPDTDVIPFGSSWRHLFPQNFDQNPNLGDFLFDDTWFLEDYPEQDLDTLDGVISWQGPDPSPIGYGTIDVFENLFGGFATEIMPTPPADNRAAAYLRQQFNRPAGIPQNGPFVLEFGGDDGFVFYLDGEPLDVDPADDITRYNCCQDTGDVPVPEDIPPVFTDLALSTGPENVLITREVEGMTLSAGSHLLAVSMHQGGFNSSDIGLEMRLFVPGNGRPWANNVDGDWANPDNWQFGLPNTRQSFAILGDAITTDRTIFTDSARTLDGIQFEDANSYNIAGTGSVNLAGNSRDASLNVLSTAADGTTNVAGDHQFQVRVNLDRNTDALIEDGSSITFNNRLGLNGNTLTKTGLGDLLVRNSDNSGSGTINVSEGVLGGGGKVSGNVNVNGGAIAPGGSVNAASNANTLTISGNANVTTGEATLTVFGSGDSDAISGGGSGNITFGAGTTINIVSAPGFTPSDGDSAQVLLDWAAINDSGATINAPGWDTSMLFVDGTISVGNPPAGCDFNGDTLCDTGDIDMLTAEIASGGNNLQLDINGDGSITIDDRDAWLAAAATSNGLGAAYLLGDANLDGAVNAGDLNEVGQSWQQGISAWSKGDFTADGTVGAPDLNVLGQSWQQAIAATANASVPEPTSLSLLVIAALGLVSRRRRR